MKQDQKQMHKRGFATMKEEKRKEIASKGGHAAHEQGVAHEWNSREARAAGKKSAKSRRRDYFKGDDLPIL
jgi:hypothetical protein